MSRAQQLARSRYELYKTYTGRLSPQQLAARGVSQISQAQFMKLTPTQQAQATRSVRVGRDFGNLAQSKRESGLYQVGTKRYRTSSQEFLKQKAEEESQRLTTHARTQQIKTAQRLYAAGWTPPEQELKSTREPVQKVGPRREFAPTMFTPPRIKEREETIDVQQDTDSIRFPTRTFTSTLAPTKDVFPQPKGIYAKTVSKIRKASEAYEIEGIREGGIKGRYKQTTGALVSSVYYPVRDKAAVKKLGVSAAKGFAIGLGGTALTAATGGAAAPVLLYGGGVFAASQVPKFEAAQTAAAKRGPVASREFLAQIGAEATVSAAAGYLGAGVITKGVPMYKEYKFEKFRKSLQPKKADTYDYSKVAAKQLQTAPKIIGTKETQLQLKPKRLVIEKPAVQQPLKPDVLKNYWNIKELGQREYLGKFAKIPRTSTPIYKTRFFPKSSEQYELISPATKDYFPFKKTATPLTAKEIAKVQAPRTTIEKGVLRLTKGLDKVAATKLMQSKKAEFTFSSSIQRQTPKVYYEKSLLETTPKGKISVSNTYLGTGTLNKVFTPIISLPKTDYALDIKTITSQKITTDQRNRQRPKEIMDLIETPRYNVRPRQIEKSKQAVVGLYDSMTKQVTQQKTTPKRYTPYTSVPISTPKPIIPVPPLIPGFPGFDFDFYRPKRQKRIKRASKKITSESRYAASLLGIDIYKATGRTRKTPTSFTSAVGIRLPVAVTKRKKYKGKKQKKKKVRKKRK